jgi:hypothetical protein
MFEVREHAAAGRCVALPVVPPRPTVGSPAGRRFTPDEIRALREGALTLGRVVSTATPITRHPPDEESEPVPQPRRNSNKQRRREQRRWRGKPEDE